MKIDVQPVPYSLIVLHALKYPHSGVCGLLLGKKNGSQVQVVGTVPITHESNPLAPTLEIALTLVHARRSDLIGVYFSNKDIHDKSINHQAAKLAEKLGSVCNTVPILLQIANWQLTANADNNCLIAFSKEDDSWKDVNFQVSSDCLDSAREAIEGKMQRCLVDFDNHLDKPELDFFNTHLYSLI